MEWLVIGIMLALGFYLAPLIIMAIGWLLVLVIGALVVIWESLFGGK